MKSKMETGSFVLGYLVGILLVLAFSAGVLALCLLVLGMSLFHSILCLAFILLGSYLLASREPPAQDLKMNESVWYDDEDEDAKR